jgi:hypothetical protein
MEITPYRKSETVTETDWTGVTATFFVPGDDYIGTCPVCGHHILADEHYYDFETVMVCTDCLLDYVQQFRR